MTNYATDCQNRFPSLWSATAREIDTSTVLDGGTSTDVAIVGAGYTGLSAALEFARAGISAHVLEGGYPGWGGSGRNSGAVIRGFKNSRSELEKEFGTEMGRAMGDFGSKVSDHVFDLIDEFSIECDLMRKGWLLPAHNKAGLKRVEARVRTWTEDGFSGLEMLPRERLADRLGSSAYIGGMIDHAGASLNPLSYARGLCRAAIGSGAKVSRDTPVTKISRSGTKWQLETPRGTVLADKVLLSTNAYSSKLETSVNASVATIHTNIVATAPLPPELAGTILPDMQAVSDIRRILYYWHKDSENRILFGTRGNLRGPQSNRDFAHVEAAMHSIYPQLKDQPIQFRWSGRVALTANFVPHINEPQPGLWSAFGYCGRGVAMATAFGQLVAKAMRKGGSPRDLPVPSGPAPRMPPDPFKGLGVAAVSQLYRLLDRVN